MSESEPVVDFYISDRLDKPGRGDAQWDVWRSVRRSLGNDWAVGYYNYPIRDAQERFREVPDILVFHATLGIIVITCRDYKLHELDHVSNEEWVINGRSDYPLSEAKSQLARVQAQIKNVPELMDLNVSLIAALALPNLSRDEWGSGDIPELNGTILFDEDCTPTSLRERLSEEAEEPRLSDEMFNKARKRLNQGDILASQRDPIDPGEIPETKRELYRAAAHGFKMHEQDRQQEQIGLHIPEGPQQIRGIAGSGKTTIIAKKAATMHLRNPEWKIAFTFNTRSLYQTIEETISNFYRDLSGGDEVGPNLDILHAWGQKPSRTSEGEHSRGMYREIALEMGVTPYRLYQRGRPSPSFHSHCSDLMDDEQNIPEMYDAILIDEAQDFRSAFFELCHEALSEPKRLIWAYDEAQTLSQLTAPSPGEIFQNVDVNLSGAYPGGVNKSFVMKQSYRTPRDVLMAAHALGMGLCRDEGIVHTLTRRDHWEAIGYEVQPGCNFSEIGSEIRIRRDRDLSPHPLQSFVDPGELFEYTFSDSYEEEAEELADEVIHDIRQEGLRPDQIMIICVGPRDNSSEPGETSADALRNRISRKVNAAARERLDGLDDTTDLIHLAGEGNRDEFWNEGQVTLSHVNRAKGNEAAMVYVAGAEQMQRRDWERVNIESQNLFWRSDYLSVRNEIFITITRSEGWCHIFGMGDESNDFLREVARVKRMVSESEPYFEFEAPDPNEMTGEIRLDETVPTEIGYFQEP